MDSMKLESEQAQILIKLRHWAFLVQFSLFLFAFLSTMITTSQFLTGITFITGTFLINTIFFIVKKFRVSLLGHLLLDFMLIVALLFISGGYQNPLVIIILIHFFIAPILLKTKELIIFGVIGFLSLLALGETTYTLHYGKLNFLNVFEVSILFVSVLLLLFAFWIKLLLKNLQSRNDKLKIYTSRIDRYRSLGILASGVCHELGTPLNTVSMRVQRLIKVAENEDLQVVKRNVEKCVEALRKLNLQVHNQSSDFYEEVINISSVLKSDVAKIEINKLSVRVNDIEQDYFVKIPRILLLNSISEILVNASEANGSKLQIELKKIGDQIVVEFHDNGNGFSEEIIKSFGIPFNSTKPAGTGLALYHLSNLMVMVEGKLEVRNDSKLLGGAVVSLKLVEVLE